MTVLSSLTGAAKAVLGTLNRYKLDVQGCEAHLDVESFSGREGLSQSYRYRIAFTSTHKDISLQQILRRSTTLTMQTLGQTVLGIVTPPQVHKVVHLW